MKKLFLFLFLFVPMLVQAYDAEIDGIYYNFSGDDATVTHGESVYGNEYQGVVIIPSSVVYNGKTYSVANIDRYTFYNCYRLTSISIPNSVTSIGDYAFCSCSGLTSITIPNSVTSIGDGTFRTCSGLATITIPNSVTSIGIYAFEGCSSLTTITVPNSVTSIGGYAFQNCYSLTSITIPNSVTSIGEYAFYACHSLISINIPNSITNISPYTFSDCLSLASVTIPSSVTNIGHCAFFRCCDLASITIPSSVNSIGNQAFTGCFMKKENLVNNSSCEYVGGVTFCDIELANGLLINDNAVVSCRSFAISLTIPNSVTSISRFAFMFCRRLTSVSIPNSVTNIDEGAFSTCSNLTSVYCYAKKVPSISSNTFYISIKDATLYVPAESEEAYKTSEYWKNFGTIKPLNISIDLVDGEENSNAYQYDNIDITYTRNFTNTNWNALYVPFSMQYEDWSEDFEVARLNDVHQFDDDEDGEVDRTVLELIKLKNGSVTEPNTPYMIKAKEVGEKTITLTDATLYATAENSFDVTSWYTRFTFTGTYNTVTDMATKGHYALADGALVQATSDAATLGAFRWYLDITDRNGSPSLGKARKVFLSFDDGETTEISVVDADAKTTTSIYSIGGMNMGKEKSALPKGLYIRNGKKFLIK